MIKREKKKIYYESEVVTDVFCDNCGKSLANEDNFIHRVEISSLYFIEGRRSLGGSDFLDYSLDLCEECVKPIEQLVRNIENIKTGRTDRGKII